MLFGLRKDKISGRDKKIKSKNPPPESLLEKSVSAARER
jgi:hypothetical protein